MKALFTEIFVPVLFDDQQGSNDSESGWKGDMGEGWWRRIYQVEKSLAPGATSIQASSQGRMISPRAVQHGTELQVLSDLNEVAIAIHSRVYQGGNFIVHEVLHRGTAALGTMT